jgi:two-component system osmolarity sensor histidine kinase EnvZ
MSSSPTEPAPQRRLRSGWRVLLRRVLPTGLFGRSLLIIVAPLVLVQVVATWAFFDQHLSTISRRLAQGAAGDIAVAVTEWGEAPATGRASVLDRVGQAVWMNFSFEADAILPNQGKADPRGYVAETMAEALREMVRRPFEIEDADGVRVVVAVQLPEGVIRAEMSRKRLFSASAYAFVLWMVGSSLILLTIAGLFMRNQVRPMQRLALAAERFGKGQDIGGFKPEGATEVRRAATEFLRMRERIQRQLQQRTEMLAGVSHDLRTPLTRLKLELALLGSGPDIEAAQGDVNEMERMLDAYLAFVRGEGGEAAEPVDIAALLQDIAADCRRLNHPVTLDVPERLIAVVRPQALTRAVSNLVGNARKYGGRNIRLSLEASPESLDIHVDDDGPGIAPDKREEVFRPFRRLQEARTADGSASVGLGLTVTRDLARSHGGDVLLDRSPLGGLRATVHLPR